MSEGRDAATQWSNAADGWARWATARAALVPATERMLDLAGVGPGCRVLDVGCGAGEQTVMAAQRSGAAGHVLATDLAAPMIAATARTVAAAGLHNVTARVGAAEALTLDGAAAFDAAISRFVLMLIPDPVAAARGVLGMLRPGGRFAAMVHGDPARNPFNALPAEILARHGGKTLRPGAPGFFALSDPERLKAVLRHAGFVEVSASAMAIERRLDSAAAAVAMIREAFAVCQGLVDDLPAASQTAAWAEVEQALSRFQTADGFVVPGEVNLVVGRRPAGG